MKIIVLGPDKAFSEITSVSTDVKWIRINDITQLSDHKDADAYFNLNENADKAAYPGVSAPIFLNSTISTLSEIESGNSLIRINGWNSFIKRTVWEIAGNVTDQVNEILKGIGRKYILSADEPGFISARIIAMIINEAYFAVGENVSSEKEIDIAMKLGTNYPKGPFEWAEEIGLKNIFDLLTTLAKTDTRYLPAPLLQKHFAGK